MKAIVSFLSLVCASAGFGATFTPPAAPTVSDDVLLAAIAEVETGNNPRLRGRRGERGHLQILPETWRRYSRLPHATAATNPAETDRVARAYLAHIRQRLKERSLPETAFFLAAGWNAGAGWRALRPRTVSYAERVANLVEAAQPAQPERSQPIETPSSFLVNDFGALPTPPVILLADAR